MKSRFLLYFGGVLVASAIAFAEYLNFTGFCYAEGRYLSEREIMNSAIKRAINFSNNVTSDVKDRKDYRSVEDFRSANPNCCTLHKWGHPDLEDGIWVRSFGWYISVAEILFRLGPAPNEFFRANVFMSACGQVKRIEGSVETARSSRF